VAALGHVLQNNETNLLLGGFIAQLCNWFWIDILPDEQVIQCNIHAIGRKAEIIR
jgi:hypothetical protein